MEDLKQLVIRSQAGDTDAYAHIVRRFQDMAIAFGHAMLGDLHLAQDAAQDAFVAAYYELATLREPAAFAGWFRQVVFKHSDRLRRSRQRSVLSLDRVPELALRTDDPLEVVARREVQLDVWAALRALPEHQRVVLTMFYMGDYSLKEISAFLGIPVATVKSRLHAGRTRLRTSMLPVLHDTLAQQRPSRDTMFVDLVMQFFRATADGDVSIATDLLDTDPALAHAVGLEWSPYWHGPASTLHLAVMYGRADILDALLAHGADINQRDQHGWTALHFAVDLLYAGARSGYDFQGMVDVLVARGHNPTSSFPCGSAMLRACAPFWSASPDRPT